MSEQTAPAPTPVRKLCVHFPKFMQAEGRAMLRGHVGATPVKRGESILIGPGEHVRIGDCVVSCKGNATTGVVHVDLYADSQTRSD